MNSAAVVEGVYHESQGDVFHQMLRLQKYCNNK